MIGNWFRKIILRTSRLTAPRRPTLSRQTFRAMLEQLEARSTPSTNTWTGANYLVDSNWSDPQNWSLGAIPGSNDTVVFGSDAQAATSIVDIPFTVGSVVIDGNWGGTVSVNSALTISGSFSLASGIFGGNGAMSVAGSASKWSGGTLTVGSGGLQNTGTLILDTTTSNLILNGGGTLLNNGTVQEIGGNALSIENSSTLNNAKGKTYDLQSDADIISSSGGTFVNAGIFDKTNGTGTTVISCTLNNSGKLWVHKGTLNATGTVIQVSGNTLTGGEWGVFGEGLTHESLTLGSADLTTIGSKATVRLNGWNTDFTNISGLLNNQGSFTLSAKKTFTTTAGNFTNSGSLQIVSQSTFFVAGGFTQTSTGTLTIGIVVTSQGTEVGRITTGDSGAVNLAGKLVLSVPPNAEPALNVPFIFVDNGNPSNSTSGTFLNLPEGSIITVQGKTYKVSYAGASGNKVILTRIT